MALLERVRGSVSLIQIRGNRLGAVGKNIPVQHKIDKPNIRDSKFVSIQRLHSVYNDQFAKGISNLFKAANFLFFLFGSRQFISRLNINLEEEPGRGNKM